MADLGAAWFRKLHYVKTVGTILLIVLGLSAVAAALLLLLRTTSGGEVRFAGDLELDWVSAVARVAYYIVLPVFCWFVAWLRVTEAQVSHGI